MNDSTRALLEKYAHLHWSEAAALARVLGLLDALQAELAQRFPSCQSPDVLMALAQLLGHAVSTHKGD